MPSARWSAADRLQGDLIPWQGRGPRGGGPHSQPHPAALEPFRTGFDRHSLHNVPRQRASCQKQPKRRSTGDKSPNNNTNGRLDGFCNGLCLVSANFGNKGFAQDASLTAHHSMQAQARLLAWPISRHIHENNQQAVLHCQCDW